MFKSIFAAILAATALFASASAEAQHRRHGGVVMDPQPSSAHYRCNPDGQPAQPGTGWCKRNGGPSVSVPSQPGNPPVVQQQQMGGEPVSVRPLSPSEMENLKQVLRGEMQQQQRPVVYPAAPARSPTATATQQQQQEVRIVIQQAPSTTPVVTSQQATPAPSTKTSADEGIVIDKM